MPRDLRCKEVNGLCGLSSCQCFFFLALNYLCFARGIFTYICMANVTKHFSFIRSISSQVRLAININNRVSSHLVSDRGAHEQGTQSLFSDKHDPRPVFCRSALFSVPSPFRRAVSRCASYLPGGPPPLSVCRCGAGAELWLTPPPCRSR